MVERDEQGRLKKGSVLNPNGRPPTKARERFEAALHTALNGKNLQAILERLVDDARKGKPWAVTLVLAYYAGKPVERAELTGADSGPLLVKYVNDWRDQAADAAPGATGGTELSS